MSSSTLDVVHPQLHGRDKTGTGKLVLITGGSGFVAAHVLISFLEAGYRVRATVRSNDTAEKVKKSHSKYLSQLEFAIVPDIGAAGAFDEAISGVDGVIHTASPFVLKVEDNKRDLLDPAINGTNEILRAIHRFAPQVKRVVITSSFASILDLDKGYRPDHTYSEEDWNPVTYEYASKNDTSNTVAYCASKVFAEKAAFDFVDNEKPSFDVATICPPMIYGPIAHAVESADKLNTSAADFYRLLDGSEKEVPDTGFFAWVDVRDVGLAHLLAYESPEAAHQRYFLTGGIYSLQTLVDNIREAYPELRDQVPTGKPGTFGMGDLDASKVYKVSNEKSRKELGLEYFSLKDCVVDTTKSLLPLLKAKSS